jgi:hypothetical protein
VSDKAMNYLLPQDRIEAIQGLIAKYLEPAGPAFVEELVFRFLDQVPTEWVNVTAFESKIRQHTS